VRSAAEGDDLALSEAMRDWVLGRYRAEGWPDDVIDQYDRNTFWPMQVTGIRRWLRRRP
jgi:hypothetical protein